MSQKHTDTSSNLNKYLLEYSMNIASGNAIKVVCVTGAGGFIASWLVKSLLERGYNVRGTVRNLDDDKNLHLKNLEGAKERLVLHKADLLDHNSLVDAINGCHGVFHTASPVPSGRASNPEEETVRPAVEGTENVLKACLSSKVKHLVMTSSIVAVRFNPRLSNDKDIDESCWSDPDYCRKNQDWYYLSKTLSEQLAWDFAKENDLDLVTICPTLVLGPLLQSKINSSSSILLKILNGGYEKLENKTWNIVDVRDVALAHILAYENPLAAGRYLCSAHAVKIKDMLDILKRNYPQYTYPKEIIQNSPNLLGEKMLSCVKVQDLGVEFISLEQTLKDTVGSLQQKSLL